MFYVYGYFEPDSLVPFYVGKGKGKRYLVHYEDQYINRNTLFYTKLRQMLLSNISPTIIIIKNNLSENEAFELEIALISFYGRLNQGTGCLTNQTNGGDGFGNRERTYDERIKMSKPKSFSTRDNNLMKQHRILIQGRAVESYNLLSGETIKQYTHQAQVKEDNFNPCAVNDVCNGRRNHHHGLGWRYC